MPPPSTPEVSDGQHRCGFTGNATSMVSGGITMDNLARSLSGRAGGPVSNRTGLEGFYALSLTFSPPRGATRPDDISADTAAEIFTALQEQLGLKLQPEKSMEPIF